MSPLNEHLYVHIQLALGEFLKVPVREFVIETNTRFGIGQKDYVIMMQTLYLPAADMSTPHCNEAPYAGGHNDN